MRERDGELQLSGQPQNIIATKKPTNGKQEHWNRYAKLDKDDKKKKSQWLKERKLDSNLKNEMWDIWHITLGWPWLIASIQPVVRTTAAKSLSQLSDNYYSK